MPPATYPTDLTDELVERLARMQATGGGFYDAGLFPAQRTHRYPPRAVEDNTIFFTAAIVYILQQIRDDLSEASQEIVGGIIHRAVALYPRYLNNRGLKIYNFWQNHPEERFLPNGGLLARLRHFKLPEDIDTTAYVYLTQAHGEEDARSLKERLVLDANGYRRRIHHTLPPYRPLRAYSTWLSEGRMPIDFDVCALSNLLLFLFAYHLPLNDYDRDSIRFIASVLEAGDHFTHPFHIAPWYGHPALILYHVARLIATYEVPVLGGYRDKVKADLYRQGERAASFLERLLLSTSLMRLGEAPGLTAYPAELEAEAGRFPFFIGSLLTAVDSRVTWALAPYSLFHFRYRCAAHTLALVLEHEVYRRKAI